MSRRPGNRYPDRVEKALESVRFVLVGTRSAGNAGSAARALKNLGFARLVFVRPRFSPADGAARRMAVDADDLLAAAERTDDLDTALAGAAAVLGVTGRTGKLRQPLYRLDRSSDLLGELAGAGPLAVLFGCEESGLGVADLERCTHLVELPSSRECPSFNLAQAVLIVAWELRRAEPWPARRAADAPPAPHEQREAMFLHLERALLAIGFVHAGSVQPIMRRLRRLFGRALPTPLEVRILRGLARQTQWAAQQAGTAPGPPVGPAMHETSESTGSRDDGDIAGQPWTPQN
jgi:TrmH family RNA methyltransferase